MIQATSADEQFFCNLIIAGTIIFGGGPVVIPLLRDYVVVPGKSLQL
jgi:chromate transport protein ChrA